METSSTVASESRSDVRGCATFPQVVTETVEKSAAQRIPTASFAFRRGNSPRKSRKDPLRHPKVVNPNHYTIEVCGDQRRFVRRRHHGAFVA
jgi:hypothetical protein